MPDPEDRQQAEAEVELQERERELQRAQQDLARKQQDTAATEEVLAARSSALLEQQSRIEDDRRRFAAEVEAANDGRTAATVALERARAGLTEAELVLDRRDRQVHDLSLEVQRARTALVDQTREAVQWRTRYDEALSRLAALRAQLQDADATGRAIAKERDKVAHMLADTRREVREKDGTIRELRIVRSTDATQIRNLQERLVLTQRQLQDAEKILQGLRRGRT